MKKYLFLPLLILGTYVSNAQNEQRLGCATDFEWKEQIKNHPEMLLEQQKFEADFAKVRGEMTALDKKSRYGLGKKSAKYVIPVVVHIFHSNGSENISDAQVQNVIAGMNNFYAGTTPNIGLVRPLFDSLIANCEIEFRLAKKDPQGNCTNGITRTYTPQTVRGNDKIKPMMTWDTKRYLNIWVCKEVYSGATAVGGYAYLPYGFGLTSLNGVILVASQFVSDDTGAHEAGHWLGLLHPFQSDDSCSTTNDGCDDTPPTYFKLATNGTNTGRGNMCGNPTFNSCDQATPINTPDLPDMQENIMDYFSGPCSGLMFTKEQKARMWYCIDKFRSVLVSAENLAFTGVDNLTPTPCAPIAAFNTKTQTVCAGGSVNFIDYSYNTSTFDSYTWEFEGGSPSTFTGKTPGAITYANEGTYKVKLTVTNSVGSSSSLLEKYITVKPAASSKISGWRTVADWWYMNNWVAEGWVFNSGFSTNQFQRVEASYANNASMMLSQDPNNTMNSLANTYSLTSPAFNFSGANTPYFAFNYAFARGNLFNAPSLDVLTIMTSTDCGKSWITRSSVQSANISTIGSGTLASSISFTPSDATKWKEVIIQGGSVPKSPSVMFRITFEYEGGNNLYLDNVRAGDGVASGISPQMSSEIGMNVFPNPFNGTSTLSIELKEKQDVKIEIVDVAGKNIATLFEGTKDAGTQNLIIDKSALNLHTGLYFVNMNAGGSRLCQKIIVE